MKHMDQASLDAEQQREARDLHRGLKDRHVQLIALGGAIGVGLLLGSGRAISQAGPGLVFAYAAGGIVIFFIMRALVRAAAAAAGGRLLRDLRRGVRQPVRGLRHRLVVLVHVGGDRHGRDHRGRHLHHLLVPRHAAWIPALVTLGVLFGVNLIAVGLFGELEFWFALIKIVAIVLLLSPVPW